MHGLMYSVGRGCDRSPTRSTSLFSLLESTLEPPGEFPGQHHPGILLASLDLAMVFKIRRALIHANTHRTVKTKFLRSRQSRLRLVSPHHGIVVEFWARSVILPPGSPTGLRRFHLRILVSSDGGSVTREMWMKTPGLTGLAAVPAILPRPSYLLPALLEKLRRPGMEYRLAHTMATPYFLRWASGVTFK